MKKRYFRIAIGLGIVLSLGFSYLESSAQEKFPSKPIKVIVAYNPGGGTDLWVRTMQEKAEQVLGQRLILEYKPGLAGAVALSYIRNEKPDGYTIVAYVNSGIVRNPHFVKVPYNALEDFTFINCLVWAPHALTSPIDAPWNTLEEFINYARGQKEGVNYALQSIGSSAHLAMELLSRQAKIKLNHVVFKGGGEATTALLGGHLKMAVISNQGEYVRAKKLKLIAFIDLEGHKGFPEILTMKKLGYDIDIRVWYGFIGPKGMPKEIVEILDNAFYQATLDKNVVQKLQHQLDLTTTHITGQALINQIAEEYKANGEIIRSIGLKKE